MRFISIERMIYTNRFINLLSFFISIIILFILCFLFFKIPNESKEDFSDFISNIKISKDEKKIKDEKNNYEDIDLGNWYIEIPEINLKAPIAEGTNSETLNTKVGHFENTALEYGNIGLAAHNRGYKYNFFSDLKKAKKDDEIIYIHDNFKMTYIIDKIEIIKNSDWSYLEKSENNKITLITCIENQPEYRRCVQASEKSNF